MFSRTRLVLGLQPHLALNTRNNLARNTLVAHRLISHSSCSRAEHDPHQRRVETLTSAIGERGGHHAHTSHPVDAQGNEMNPYRNGPSALDKAVHLFFFTEIIRGMWIVLENFFRPPTPSCIHLKRVLYLPAFVGSTPYVAIQVVKSVASLCEAICPAQAITIESEARLDGSRKTTKYDIDMTKCIYCGFCQEACPVDAIVETQNQEFSVENREELLYNKEKLLANGDRAEAEIAANLHSDHVYR
ncbi:hypothetical protein CPB84DRAFT_1840945 [Gymnopilus junonius]|uniref:4Fe-4S ferredoxin-type domain-containing protein n=1 Tax=Gymnopilus junonius TaxID=109634 RepID=A0A9P5P510_GYMJU|nr:hypothetical protein CPB84DRAFT_1840945 [Gymnopilus junonius]